MSGRFNLADYVTVDERIDKFWDRHHADGSIQTEVCWVADDGSSVAIRASVYLGPRLIATGIAQEERGPGGANRTSWWENAETSAIGRALANYGMSLSKQRPSREEMAKVERYDEQPPAPPPPARTPAPAQTRSAPRYAPERPPQVQSPSPPPTPIAQGASPAVDTSPTVLDPFVADLAATAWRLVEDGKAIPTVWRVFSERRKEMDDAQWTQVTQEWKRIKTALEERDAAVAQPGKPAYEAG